MKIETERLLLFPVSNDELKQLIENEIEDYMKQAYSEMLRGCMDNPGKRIWSTLWFIELKSQPGTVVGSFVFSGVRGTEGQRFIFSQYCEKGE